MLGIQPLSVAPLSAIESAGDLVYVSNVDIILHEIPVGNDICLYDPSEFEVCSTPSTCCGVNGNGGGGITLIKERKKSNRSKKLAEEKALRELQEADDLECVMAILAFLSHQPYCDTDAEGTRITFTIS
jgi:hypothetical protein